MEVHSRVEFFRMEVHSGVEYLYTVELNGASVETKCREWVEGL